eukprot:6208537-Pleurochrysis_carterae.AAC.2
MAACARSFVRQARPRQQVESRPDHGHEEGEQPPELRGRRRLTCDQTPGRACRGTSLCFEV